MPSSIEKIGIFVALAAANADGLKLGGPPRGRARKSSPMGSSARYMCGTHMFHHLAKRVNGSMAGFDYWMRSKTPAVAPETEEMDVVAPDAEPAVTMPGSKSEEYIYGNEFLQLLPAFMMVQYWSNDQKTWISTRLISYGIDKKKDLCGDGHKYYHLTAKEGCFNLDEIRVKRDGFHESKAQANLWLQELGKFKTMLEIEDFIFNKLSWESADKQAVTNFFKLAAIKMEQAQQVEMLKVDLEKKYAKAMSKHASVRLLSTWRHIREQQQVNNKVDFRGLNFDKMARETLSPSEYNQLTNLYAKLGLEESVVFLIRGLETEIAANNAIAEWKRNNVLPIIFAEAKSDDHKIKFQTYLQYVNWIDCLEDLALVGKDDLTYERDYEVTNKKIYALLNSDGFIDAVTQYMHMGSLDTLLSTLFRFLGWETDNVDPNEAAGVEKLQNRLRNMLRVKSRAVREKL